MSYPMFKLFDGKVIPKEYRPYLRCDLDLTPARTMQKQVFTNSLIYVEKLDGTCKIYINHRDAPEINLTESQILITPFERFYVTNSAQAGKSCNLLIANADFFRIALKKGGVTNHALLSNVLAAQHHAATVAGDLDLNDLNEKLHASLASVTSDQHHAQAHNLASHSTKAHTELTGVAADQHGDIKIRTKEIDETNIGNGKVPVYRVASGKLEYEAQAGGGGAWAVVGDQTLGSDVTSVTFSGLDMDTTGIYVLLILDITAILNDADLRLFYNGDETVTNYYIQQLQINNTSINASRTNDAWILYTTQGIGRKGFAYVIMGKLSGGMPRAFNLAQRPAAANNVTIDNFAHVRNNTENVTSITIKCRNTDGIAAGSRFILMELV